MSHDRYDTNQQERTFISKFWVHIEEKLYYLCGENKGADVALFSPMQKSVFLMMSNGKKSHKWRQHPGIHVAVDWEVEHQLKKRKQTNSRNL